jgi:hypothetical protein
MADDKKLEQKIEGINDNLNDTLDYITDIGKNLSSGLVSQFVKVNENTRQLAEGLLTSKDLTKDLAKLNSELVKLNTKNTELGIKKSIAEQALQEASAKYNQNQSIANARSLVTAKNNLKSLALQIQITDKLRDQVANVKSIAEEEQKVTGEKRKQNSLIGNAKTLFQDMVKPLTELFSVMGILKAIVAGANNFDKISVNTSKTLGYTTGRANDVARNFQAISLTAQSTNVTMKSLAEATNEISESTGLVSEYSAETLKTQIMLTKQFGLTGEEAAGIYKFSVLSGKSSEKINDEMVGAFVASRNTLRVGANFKAVMAEAAKVSGQLAANFRNNPAEITKAIVQAKALGTTLEQSKNQGEALLNFETSLENELKAELLTGQQLNLERARAAALQGDQVTVMKELANQGMTLEKFQGMNVLAQKSFAEALGLSADALSDQLAKQKLAQESGKSLAEITKDEALEAQKRQTIEDRFAATVEKLKDIIGSIGTLLAPAFQLISFLVDNTFVLYGILGLIALNRIPAIAKGFKGIAGDIKESALNAKKLFSKEGRAEIFGGAGAKKPEIPDTPDAGKAGKGVGGFMDSLKGIKTTDMIKAAAAILILAGALFVAAKAFQEFAEVKWEDMAKAGIALVGLAAVAGIMGTQPINGFIIAGAFALGLLGAALIPFALAARIATPAIQAFGDVLFKAFTGLGIVITAAANGIATIFGSLQNVDAAKLLAIGPALIGIGVGLASLGAGGVIAAIGSFLGGDPIKKIETLAASGDGLQKAATGLQGVALGLTQVATALSAIDTSKLEALSDFSTQMSIGSAVKGITDFIAAPIKAIGSAIGGEGGTDNAPMVAAINEVRDAVNKLYTKNNDVYIDSVKVMDSAQKKGSYRMA